MGVRKYLRKCWDARFIYLLLLPGMTFIFIFSYGPMYGLQLAFKQYNAGLGILGSNWIGLTNFQNLIARPDFFKAFTNTIIISLSRLVIEFPFPILLSLMLNELRLRKLKRVLQTVFTFPHFLSWVVVSSILLSFMDSSGPLNSIIHMLTGQKVAFLGDTSIFRPILYSTSIWKGAGWSSIIYLAAIAGINPELYEAAVIDGANRLQRIWHITLPCILPTITVLFILAVGGIMDGGFDQIFNMQNPVVRPVAETIDIYVYRITFESPPNYGFSTAVGMFKSVINFIMLILANRVVRTISGSGLFR
ncbi:MAG: ABC transporter permease subunit [Oscillospiraceae bacterium]|nr:ABC transporter permease subunit [Oscillospiraceae bacterium]